MGISDQLSNFRQLLPGTRPVDDERLLALFWNRAELKKEYSRLQDDCISLRDKLKKHEGLIQRSRDQFDQLQDYLGDPTVGMHALVYFQLRGLWKICRQKLTRFSLQLRRQQEDRERRRQLIENDQARHQALIEIDRQIADVRAEADVYGAQLKVLKAELAALRGFWNYFRRRERNEEALKKRAELEVAAARMVELAQQRASVENTAPPEFVGISIDGRRIVNTATIAYAQQLVLRLSAGGLAVLAKETMGKPVYDVRYGSREDCVRQMLKIRDATAALADENEDLEGLKERTDELRATAAYRSDADTIPLTDSIGNLPAQGATVSGLEVGNRSGINVLVDDYWDLYQALLQ